MINIVPIQFLRRSAMVAMLLFSGAAMASEAKPEENPVVDPAQIARGAQAWAQHCQRCHNLRSPSELEDYEWDVSVNHMRVRANLPGDLAEDIKAFLKSSN